MVEGRLLLVDDEPSLLDLLQRYLGRLGYAVDGCASPESALALFSADPARYALVLTDLTLEGMSGEEMIERMRALNPSLRAIVSSGYPYEPRTRATQFLLKPYAPKMLADLIAKLLKAV
ncbi:MAG TPA: response regulator [Bryobacteraceae bacterium]|nr:response regulator [Bryobacteraceae bacterium]